MTKKTPYFLIAVLSLFYFLFHLANIDQFGQTADSSLVLKRGAYYFYDYPSLGYQGIYEKIPNAKLRSYGPLYSSVAVASKHYLYDVFKVFSDPVHAYHFPNIVTASFAVFVLGVFIYWVWGFPTALLTVLLLMLAPKFFGHTQTNYKDISTLAIFLLAMISLYYAVVRDKLLLWAISGMFVGICYCVRAHALMLLPIISLWYFLVYLVPLLVKFLQKKDGDSLKRFFTLGFKYSAQVIFCLAIASCTVIIFWPYYRVDPLGKFLETFGVMSGFEWQFTERYFGKLYQVDQMPWHYPIVYLAISLPTFYLIAFISGFFLTIKRVFEKSPDASLLVLLFITVIIPPAIHIALGTPKYGGMRHYLLVYPYLIAIIAYTLASLVKYYFERKNYLSKLIIVLPLFILINQLYQNYKLYPVTYVYFNSLVGGEAGAEGQFTLDIRKQARQHVNRWKKEQLAKNPKQKFEIYFSKDLERMKVAKAEAIKQRKADFVFKANQTPIAYVFLVD